MAAINASAMDQITSTRMRLSRGPMRSTTRPQKNPPRDGGHNRHQEEAVLLPRAETELDGEVDGHEDADRVGRLGVEGAADEKSHQLRVGASATGRVEDVLHRAPGERKRRQPLHRASWFLDPEKAGEGEKEEADRRETEDGLVVAATGENEEADADAEERSQIAQPDGGAPDAAPVVAVCSPQAGARHT